MFFFLLWHLFWLQRERMIFKLIMILLNFRVDRICGNDVLILLIYVFEISYEKSGNKKNTHVRIMQYKNKWGPLLFLYEKKVEQDLINLLRIVSLLDYKNIFAHFFSLGYYTNQAQTVHHLPSSLLFPLCPTKRAIKGFSDNFESF